MDEVMLKSGTWPNVAIEAGSDLKAMKPVPVENRSVFDEPEEPEATPARFAEARKVILNGESYKLDTREHMDNGVSVQMCPNGSLQNLARHSKASQVFSDGFSDGQNKHETVRQDELSDTREQLEEDMIKLCHMDMLQARPFLELLDRQAAITERQCMERATSERVGWDCAECAEGLGKRIAELTAERDEQIETANTLRLSIVGLRDSVESLTAERDELKHANSLLQSAIAELGVKVDEKQAELLEARASGKADPVEIQLALARFAEEWVLADTRVQEQRCIVYHAQHIADLVDDPGGGE